MRAKLSVVVVGIGLLISATAIDRHLQARAKGATRESAAREPAVGERGARGPTA